MIATRGMGAGFGATLPTGGLGAGYGGAPPEGPGDVSVPNTWTVGQPLRWPNLWQDEEIIFLRRKTSNKAGV